MPTQDRKVHESIRIKTNPEVLGYWIKNMNALIAFLVIKVSTMPLGPISCKRGQKLAVCKLQHAPKHVESKRTLLIKNAANRKQETKTKTERKGPRFTVDLISSK